MGKAEEENESIGLWALEEDGGGGSVERGELGTETKRVWVFLEWWKGWEEEERGWERKREERRKQNACGCLLDVMPYLVSDTDADSRTVEE